MSQLSLPVRGIPRMSASNGGAARLTCAEKPGRQSAFALEACSVNLMAGFLGREAPIRLIGGGAVIDDGVDLAGDR